MRVLVCGSTGCVGTAVVNALRTRGHQVVAGARGLSDGAHSMHVDYMQPVDASTWAQRLAAQRIEAVVNCVGILIPARGQSFERVHALGPIELFRGAAAAGVKRVLQVSALGVGSDAQALAMPYLHSKLRADDALAALPIDGAILRPSLIYGPGSQSAQLFATLASLPVISLPGRGAQRVQPVHVFELAEAMVRLIERPEAARGIYEIAGPASMSYREMLAAYRRAQGLGEAIWLPLPMVLMKLTAVAAEVLPQKVYSRDTMRMLERGSVTASNALHDLLGRAPSTLAHGLAVTAPQPAIDLRVHLSPTVAWALRCALAFMWIYTALISSLLPTQSGVLHLLARCGFEGRVGIAVLIASCTLNLALGTLTLWRPSPWLYAVQSGAVLGYGLTAAFNMPELTLDHCAPLVKNVPVLMAVVLLWLAQPPRAAPQARGGQVSQAVAPMRSPHRSTSARVPLQERSAASPRT